MEELHRNMKTVMLVLLWVSMGLYTEIAGPTMLDLKMRFDSNYEQIARAVSADGFGVFFGALIGGLLVDVMGTWKDLLLTGSQVLVTLAILCMPYVGSSSILWLMFFVIGTCGGVVNVVGQRILLEMWKSRAPSPMHAMHMGFGIGAVLAPLIANNFLASLKFYDDDEDLPGNGTSNSTTPYTVNIGGRSERFSIVEESQVEYAYITIGLVSAVISIPVFIYPCLKCSSARIKHGYVDMEKGKSLTLKTLVAMINPSTFAQGSKKFGVFVFAIISLFYLNLVGAEQLFGNFIRTFSVDQLHFPRNEASYLDTVFWTCFTLGRLTGSLLARCISIRNLVLVDVSLNLVSITLMNIFSTNSKAMLWLFTAFTGFVIAPIFPAFVSYLNTHIEVGGVVLTLIVFATGCGHAFYLWITGVLYQNYGPETLLYAMQASSVFVFVIALIFIIATRNRKDRFQNEYNRMSTPSEETTFSADQ